MHTHSHISALLISLGPCAILGAVVLGEERLLLDSWPLPAAAASWTLFTLAGLLYDNRPKLSFAILLGAVAAFWISVHVSLLASPIHALLVFLFSAVVTVFAVPTSRRSDHFVGHLIAPTSRGWALRVAVSSRVALAAWFLVWVGEVTRHPLALASVAVCIGISFNYFVDWLEMRRRKPMLRLLWLLAAVAVVDTWLSVIGVYHVPRLLWAPAVLPVVSLLFVNRRLRLSEVTDVSWFEPFLSNPARALFVTFGALSLLGAALLRLPVAVANGVRISFVDALFTSVSAVCVTGLTVVDTGADFSRAGQMVILLLIQLGGLGIMSLSVATLAMLGRRLDLRAEGAAAGLLSGADRGLLYRTWRGVLLVTLISEVVGIVFLTAEFVAEGVSFPDAVYEGAFTAISAYCNAGFALRSDSLVSMARNPAVLHTVGGLIVIGGVSPAAVLALPRLWKRSPVRLEIKIALLVTAALLGAGALSFAVLEWQGVLSGLPWMDKLHNAWFQSLTTRTAGFNSVNIAALHPSTMLIVMILMFIGGCPGGTAGGIKTTTAAVLWLAAGSALFGKGSARAFGRKISVASVYKAVAVLFAGMLVAVVAMLGLLLTQQESPRLLAFEVLSALGTVGLSMGATTRLDEVGKFIVMVCMFLGRVGPLSLLVVLAEKRDDGAVLLLEENVDVG